MAPDKTPDLLLVNAYIVTMDALAPRAEAMAIKNGRIVAIGRNEDIASLRGHSTEVVDANGQMVLPGLQDTHLHLQDSGYYFATMADLSSCTSIEQLQSVIKSHTEEHPDGWILGIGWHPSIFNENTLDRHILDAVTGNRPCLITAVDLHSACLNTAGCNSIGLDASTLDPRNGRITRDDRSEPTGMLHEEAITWAKNRMPPTTDEDYRKGVRFAQAHANRHGITGVIDAWVTERHCRVYHGMAAEDALTLRISGAAKIEPEESVSGALERLRDLRTRFYSKRFTMNSAKFFLDGVLENRTAAMIDGYADSIGGNAPLMFEPSTINEMFAAFDADRFQIHVHVIGDLAARAAMDGLEFARNANGVWPSYHQLAHLECVRPSDIARLQELGCVANIQTLWAQHYPGTIDIAAPMAGPALANLIYPFGSLLETGTLWTLSSDWGVSTLNPFQIMETAVTRQPPGARQHPIFAPEQRLTRKQALEGYTINAAKATWRDGTGRLSYGNNADFIIIDQDVLNCDSYAIGETKVLKTFFEGKEVYSSNC